MNGWTQAAGGVLACSAVGCGIALIRKGARLSGFALLGFATSLVGSAIVRSVDPGERSGRAAAMLVACAWAWCCPAALLAFPTPILRKGIGAATWLAALCGGGIVTFGVMNSSAQTAGILVIGAASIAQFIWRLDTAPDGERLSLLWMSSVVSGCGLIFGHAVFLLPRPAALPVGLSAAAVVPLTLVLSLYRPLIVDVRGLIVEGVVLEVAVVAYLAVFVGVTSTATLLGAEGLPTGTLALIGAITAVGFHPLRVILRRAIDELLFGSRPDPLDAATRVADRIGGDPVQALVAVCEAMVLPFASIVVDGEELARSGTPVSHTRRLSLLLGDDTVGEIVVGLRPGDLHLSSSDERVLRIVAPLLAQTIRAQSLAADLRMSRGHAINAIEEERRRLRRDLHDGLGPTLSGIAFTADAARNSLEDPSTVDALLQTVRYEASTAISEIRRLVYGMRPPALDELGLIGALRQSALNIRIADGRLLIVAVQAPSELPSLPAAVEVAAYRIAIEALANAALHSGSDRAEVALTTTAGHLVLEVIDGGSGHEHWTPGVGLTSMRERAAEIGGTIQTRPAPAGGRVIAKLPLDGAYLPAARDGQASDR